MPNTISRLSAINYRLEELAKDDYVWVGVQLIFNNGQTYSPMFNTAHAQKNSWSVRTLTIPSDKTISCIGMKTGKGIDLRGIRLIDEHGHIFLEKMWCIYSNVGFWEYKDIPKGQHIVGFESASDDEGLDIGRITFLLASTDATSSGN